VNLDPLFLLVVGGLIFFAVVDLAVARTAPSAFISLETKTDALYFAVATLSTVGFGDVHAQGQIARGLVIVQMVFNVVVLTRAANPAGLACWSALDRSRQMTTLGEVMQ